MLILKYVNDTDAAIRLFVGGRGRGAIARPRPDGCRPLCFDATSAVLRCERLAPARARGRIGLLTALLARLRPDKQYCLVDGDTMLAQLRNVVRWGRGSHLELTLPGGACWRVHGRGLLPKRLRVERDGVQAGDLLLEGVWRAQLRMPRLPLPPLVALALGAVVLEVWGNDPWAGESGE